MSNEKNFNYQVGNKIHILLTQSKEAIIDIEDRWILQYKWAAVEAGKTFYATTSSRTKVTQDREGRPGVTTMHQLILHPVVKPQEVDHKDRNGLNNSRSNIHIVTKSVNQKNKGTPKSSTSGVSGVVPHYYKSKIDGSKIDIWQAYVRRVDDPSKFKWKRFSYTDQGLEAAKAWVKETKEKLYT